MLSRAGIESAITNPDGTIRSASAGFAARAIGVRPDRGQRVRPVAAYSGRSRPRSSSPPKASSGTLDQGARLEDPTRIAVRRQGEDLRRPGSDRRAGRYQQPARWPQSTAIPQLEALLSALPLGLALTDRDGAFLFASSIPARSVDREGRALPNTHRSGRAGRQDPFLSDAVRRHGRGVPRPAAIWRCA